MVATVSFILVPSFLLYIYFFQYLYHILYLALKKIQEMNSFSAKKNAGILTY